LLLPPPRIGRGWVNDELVDEVEAVLVLGAVVTDSSVVGNVVAPLALTGGFELTTALSVVGNNGGALADGAGELDDSAV
jgi:hypothetical protein